MQRHRCIEGWVLLNGCLIFNNLEKAQQVMCVQHHRDSSNAVRDSVLDIRVVIAYI
jgi:hypothetical protein